MGRRALCAAVCVALVALGGGPASSAFAATPVDDLLAPVPIVSPTGSYVVVLEDAPAASYAGGVEGLAATMPDPGEKLDPHSSAVKKYTAFLDERQSEVAVETEVEPAATYRVTLNGFSAKMSPEKAAQVAASDGVLAVYPDEIFRPDAAPSTDFLGLDGPSGVWASLGGADGAGSGVVIGVIDTGIAAENPSFAGDRLRAVRGSEPHLVGNRIVFEKADGREFRSTRVTGDQWAKSDYSTKLIGARYFATGATGADFDFDHDVLSPRDSDGHGSHAASIAAGESGVDASVDGVDFGPISGVAPAAKIAAYKACFVGADPLVTSDDVCVGSDLLAAVEQAVADGVDVISYSVGGGAAASAWGADDISFYNAAVAGVFIATSAGNTGPGVATVGQRGAPWYTTVAASTIPGFEASVELSTGFQAAGVSVSVPSGAPVSAPVVYAGNAGLAGAADAHLCYLGTLDPVQVAGRIVVCDRGTNPRTEKSQEVADAGGVGMVIANVTPDSLDSDFHAVPTVHIDSSARTALLAELAAAGAGVTATLIGENVTGVEIPAPQVAGFSSRGPSLDLDGAVLTPDVAAPGVAILGARQDSSSGRPAWGMASGTSMAAAHVAGLAALYLGAHSAAPPDEVKSAIMTTAYDTVTADGSAAVDPFAQGAGHIDPGRALDPGLLYLSGAVQWTGFLQAQGHADSDALEVEGEELNLPSIAIGTLTQQQTVSRTLTATREGSYRVTANIPGVDVTVRPSTLVFQGPGDTQRFAVTFTNRTAPVEVWATGFLTWTGQDGTVVRSPLAVKPATVDATALVATDGIAGSIQVSIVSGVDGEVPLEVAGLAPVELLVDADDSVPGHSGDGNSGDANGNAAWIVEIPGRSPLAQFTLQASDDSDLDLAVYRVASPTDLRYDARWVSAMGSGEKQVTLRSPAEGSYLVVADVSDATAETTWDLTSAVVSPGASRALTSETDSLVASAGEDVRYTLSWAGLKPDTRYLGVVTYGDSPVQTLVQVDSGSVPPTSETPPTLEGDPEVGEILTALPGTWEPDDVEISYQWFLDGEPIPGAQARDYQVRPTDVGAALSAQVTATQPGTVNPGIAVTDEVVVSAGSTVVVEMDPYKGTTADQYAVTVEVTTSRGAAATGAVVVWVDATQYTGTLADGRVTFTLPEQKPGIHVVVAEYAGTEGVDGSTGVSGFVVGR